MNWYHGGDSYIHVTHNDPFTLSQILDLSFRNTLLMPNKMSTSFFTLCGTGTQPVGLELILCPTQHFGNIGIIIYKLQHNTPGFTLSQARLKPVVPD